MLFGMSHWSGSRRLPRGRPRKGAAAEHLRITLMIYEAARHEALDGSRWNETTSREYIQRIAADANATFSRRDLWPTHPLEEARPGTRFCNLYVGAAGVVWALNRFPPPQKLRSWSIRTIRVTS